VRIEVATAVTVKITVCWDKTPYSLVDAYQCFRGAWCHNHEGRSYCARRKKLRKRKYLIIATFGVLNIKLVLRIWTWLWFPSYGRDLIRTRLISTNIRRVERSPRRMLLLYGASYSERDSFTLQSVLRQVRSLLQSEISIRCDLVLPLTISIIFSFP
jgi:hypothetical protein